MDNLLVVEVKNVYGNELVYPVSDNAIILCNMTESKTFSKTNITRLKALGYIFRVTTPSLV